MCAIPAVLSLPVRCEADVAPAFAALLGSASRAGQHTFAARLARAGADITALRHLARDAREQQLHPAKLADALDTYADGLAALARAQLTQAA